MTHPAYDEDTTVPTTTMSQAVNEVNAAIVAAVAAGDSTTAFTTEGSSIRHIDTITVDSAVIDGLVSTTPSLKRPAEDDAEDIEDSVKLRKLQEEVNHNANAAAGILSSSAHSSAHSSSHSSPSHSTTLETHVPIAGKTKETSGSDGKPETTVTATPTTTHLTATSHSSIMADLERMQQLAKIDPAQLASYSTNPSNQATLEQLTSSALATVLAQAPPAVTALQSNLQLQQEHEQQHEQQQEAVEGILVAMPSTTESATAHDSASSQDEDEATNGKRTSSRNMTNDERRQRRLLRNRVAAKECRKKKKAYVTELQDTCSRLQEENTRLYKEVEELNAKLTLGAMRIDENVRLIKEVEELNAKLTLGVMSGVHEPIAVMAPSSKHEDDTSTEPMEESHTRDEQQHPPIQASTEVSAESAV